LGASAGSSSARSTSAATSPWRICRLPPEENRFSACAVIRLSLERPDLLRSQLSGDLKAAALSDIHVMFPMISTLDELRAARRILDEEQRGVALGARGVMIEVPSRR